MKNFDINFKLLLISNAISNLGVQILRFALILFLVDLTRSATVLGVATAITQIPLFLLAPVGGSMADRMNKKQLIVMLDAASTVLCLILFVIFWQQAYTVVNLTIIMTILVGIVTVAGPVFFSAMPLIVKEAHLVEANGAISSLRAISNLAGPALGGVF